MDYIEVELTLSPLSPFREILVALLAEVEFESFMDTKEGMQAFIAADAFDDDVLDETLAQLEGVQIEKTIKRIAHKNWNEAWEKDYHPVEVDERCVIRALFHEPMPQYEYEIIIQPQMSFGTGHHPTTLTIARVLLDMDLMGKSLLDLGTGTGVLAILAEKKGSVGIVATDIEDHIIENARDNVRHNDCVEIRVDKADLAQPGKEKYAVILANINLNTLVAGLPSIVAQAKKGATVLLSGFYEEDAESLIEAAKPLGLQYTNRKTHRNWAVLSFEFNP
jgi:ribosomal protein L11 methyltransferase